jgi:hypothetical protein
MAGDQPVAPTSTDVRPSYHRSFECGNGDVPQPKMDIDPPRPRWIDFHLRIFLFCTAIAEQLRRPPDTKKCTGLTRIFSPMRVADL